MRRSTKRELVTGDIGVDLLGRYPAKVAKFGGERER